MLGDEVAGHGVEAHTEQRAGDEVEERLAAEQEVDGRVERNLYGDIDQLSASRDLHR